MERIIVLMDPRVKYTKIAENNIKISAWIELDLLQIAKLIFDNISNLNIGYIIVSLLRPGKTVDIIQITNYKEGNYKNILMNFTFDNEIILNSPQYNNNYTDNNIKINKILLGKCMKALSLINDIGYKKLCKDFFTSSHLNFKKYLLNNLDFLNHVKNNGIANLYVLVSEFDFTRLIESTNISVFNKRFASNEFEGLSEIEMNKYGVVLLLISILNSNKASCPSLVESTLKHILNKEEVKFVFDINEFKTLINISSTMTIFEFLNNLIKNNEYSTTLKLNTKNLELFKSKLYLYEHPNNNSYYLELYDNSFDWLGKRITENDDDYNKYELFD